VEVIMQGVHAFDPKATVSIDLESFVAADHFLRRVDRVLDLSFVRDLTAPRYAVQQGRPSIDPEVYFRMQLVAYFFGVTSERQLWKTSTTISLTAGSATCRSRKKCRTTHR
jgi:transposase